MANPTQDDLGSNNPFNVGSFFFANAAKNSPLSYEALQTRRKIAESLLGRRSQLPFPKTLGEGLTYASKELADAYENRQTLADLEQRDREFQQGASQLPIPGAGPVPPTAAPTTAAPPGAAADNGSGDGGGSPVVAAADTSLSPYAPSAAGPDETPLPPPRPVIDRSQQLGDMNDDPSLLPRLAAATMGELNPGASLPEQRTQFATALDRAGARGIPLSQALETYTGRGSRGYYPPDVVPRGAAQLRTPEQQQAFMRNVATPVLRGADPGGAALGFTPTGNASGGVADRGIASGRYGNAGSFPGRNETYVTQERGRPLPFSAGGPDTTPGVNPDATRNAIASAMMAAPPVPFAGGTGAPGGGPDAMAPAGPGNAQVASLGDASGLLGNLRPQGAARQMNREAPLMPVPQGVPGNPAIQSDISPAPPPQQVAQLMGQGAQGGAGGAGGGGPAPVLGSLPPGIPNTKPVPPILNTQPTKEEIFGMQLLRAPIRILPIRSIRGQKRISLSVNNSGKAPSPSSRKPTRPTLPPGWKAPRLGSRNARPRISRTSSGKAGVALVQPVQAVPARVLALPPNPRVLGTPQSPQRNGVPEVAPPPPGVTPKQWSTTQAPIVAARVEAVTKAVPQFDEMIKTINAVRNHEGKESGTGPLSNIARGTNGTLAYDFGALLNQLKGKNFLQAYQLLKGSGAISNIEGEKSEQAQAALDPNQSTRGFNSGLQRLEDQVRGDLEIAQRRMHMPVTAWRKGNDNTSYAPDIGQVYRGMRYIGGDPHDTANSWVREQ